MDSKRDKIIASYEWHNDDDISTERLLAMVADDCDCDVSRVAEVLGEYWESINEGEAEIDTPTNGIVMRNEILNYIDRVKNSGLGKRKSLEYIRKYVDGMDLAKGVDADLISRQAAIKALGEEPDIAQDTDAEWAERDTWARHIRAIESLPSVESKLVCEDAISRRDLSDKVGRYYEERGDFGSFECFWILEAIRNAPPVEPPKKVVAQIKIDAEEIVERIKEEYEIKEKPVCEDAISRADAINVRCAHCDTRDCCRDCSEVDILLSLPPVEPERPKREWVDRQEGTFCSECDYKTNEYHNFCPNCGADMRGADDE